MTRRLDPWLAVPGAACAVRIAVPLAALAASGRALPGLPHYDYDPTPGDGQGFYSAARDFMAAWGRLGAPALGLLVLAAAAALVGCVVLARRGRAAWAVPLGALTIALVLVAPLEKTSSHTGAATVGWPLVWAVPMLPYRALGGALDPRTAFGLGLALSLLAICVSTVCTWLIGLRATGSRAAAAVATLLFGFWPLLARPLSGPGAWQNGTWHVDAGLHMYDEPVSTALVAVALVLLLGPPRAWCLALAGVLLGIAVSVRLSDAVLAAVALAFVLAREGLRRTLPFALGLVSFVPVIAAWWPKGYAALFDRADVWPRHPFALSHAWPAWSQSLLFTPRLLAILVPLALIGALTIERRRAAALLGALVLTNAAFYSLYAPTPLHPRFMYAVFPALFTLVAAGIVRLVPVARGRPARAAAQ